MRVRIQDNDRQHGSQRPISVMINAQGVHQGLLGWSYDIRRCLGCQSVAFTNI